MCAACGHYTGLSWLKTLIAATPVPLALAAGFLVPSGEDKLILWVLGVIVMAVLCYRWAPRHTPPLAVERSEALSRRRP
jgi:hypothetical protein